MSLQKGMKFSKAEKDLIRLGSKQEQERIIKLLEEQDWLPSIKAHIIALIKGEK